jgi:hypothetical protein
VIEQLSVGHRSELSRPVRAFITFKKNEACEMVKKHLQSEKSSFWETVSFGSNTLTLFDGGEPLEVTSAPEPSDIIWEN